MKKLFFVFMIFFIGCANNHPNTQSLKHLNMQDNKNINYQIQIKNEKSNMLKISLTKSNLNDENVSKNKSTFSFSVKKTYNIDQNFTKILFSLSKKHSLEKISKIYKIKNTSLLYINLGPIVHFDTNKYKIKNRYFSNLNKIINNLKECNCSILVVGHTDSIGSDRYNQALSELRARAVYQYMLQQGISKNRLDYIGYGEEQPLSTNATSQGRAINRRVELLVSKDLNVSFDFLKNRDINTSYWNNHNVKTAGKIEISKKGWTKGIQLSKIKNILIKLKKKKRESFSIKKDNRTLNIKLKKRIFYIKGK